MSERPKRVSKQERFTYSWYLPSQRLDQPKAEAELGNPEGDFDEEPEIAEDSAAMMGIESTVQSPSQGFASSRSSGIYSPKHHSSGMKSSFLGVLHIQGSMRIRIGVEAGWSALVGAGTVALLTRAGPFPGNQIAELGAVWGGIAAFLWIVLAKLSK